MDTAVERTRTYLQRVLKKTSHIRVRYHASFNGGVYPFLMLPNSTLSDQISHPVRSGMDNRWVPYFCRGRGEALFMAFLHLSNDLLRIQITRWQEGPQQRSMSEQLSNG